MKRLIFLLLCVFLVSCEQQFDPDKLSEGQCNTIGGKWHLTMSNTYTCNPPTNDGGKECTDTGECEGSCDLDVDISEIESLRGKNVVGRCTQWRSSAHLSCWVTVIEGEAAGICV